jgi:hypothetical protein
MCVVVLLALVGTAYMAVFFNRRAKADLTVALEPLAQVVEGEANVEDAYVTGKYRGHLAEGRVAQLPGGMGRVFNSLVIDGAGGGKWMWTISRAKEPGETDTLDFEGTDGPEGTLALRLRPGIEAIAAENSLAGGWFKVEYDPAPGHVRLTRPMKTRRDIPDARTFQSYLTHLVELADANRAVQYRAE